MDYKVPTRYTPAFPLPQQKRMSRKKKPNRQPKRKTQNTQEAVPQNVAGWFHLSTTDWAILGISATLVVSGVTYYSPSPDILYLIPAGLTLVIVRLVWKYRTGNRKAIFPAALGVIILLFLAFVVIVNSRNRVRQEASLNGPTFRPGIEKVDLTFGSNHFIYDVSQLQKTSAHPLMLGGLVPIILYAEGDKLYADVTLYGGSGLPVVEVKHNSFIVRPPGWDANSDSSALEVVDSQLHPVFQMTYASEQHIIINGYFPYPGGLVVATDAGMTNNPTGALPPLTRIFRYPSWKYPSQRFQ